MEENLQGEHLQREHLQEGIAKTKKKEFKRY